MVFLYVLYLLYSMDSILGCELSFLELMIATQFLGSKSLENILIY